VEAAIKANASLLKAVVRTASSQRKIKRFYEGKSGCRIGRQINHRGLIGMLAAIECAFVAGGGGGGGAGTERAHAPNLSKSDATPG